MKESIAWECAHCGKRHLWEWDKGEAMEVEITMEYCERCFFTTKGKMARIGKNAWALTNPRKA